MNVSWLFVAVALLVGALITVQTGSNARMKEAFGEALPAVVVSSSLGVVLLVTVTLFARASSRARSCSTISAGSASASTPPAWGASWAVC